MTDNEIIKAYELCFAERGTSYTCAVCPYHQFGELCKVNRDKDALDLINRLQAENERLNEIAESIQKDKSFLGKEITKYHKELLKSKVFKFVRDTNRIYNFMDFKDGEMLVFYDYPEKTSALSKGYLFFKGKHDIRLVNIKEVKELSLAEIKAEAYKECIEKLKEKTKGLIGQNFLDDFLKEMVGEDNAK